ncbi:DNase I-like protein [Polyplosphaeria fusca]|uniref:DNA-(apurinic or apyrimidinic site) endonuclease 2 n=1 Tax=Polyplosphaeria fusca TaxID=682080 RepID=A0A9P4R1K4_9PLEO|nr:DNase I-like protein [Polyplosphaeria fusca]
MLRITSWNVNGIRNPFGYQPWAENRTFNAMFDILEADIVIMQELKIQRKDLRDDMVLIPGWDCFFSLPKHKKGYSGVGIYTRQSVCAPIRAEEGLLGVLCPPGSSTHYRDLPDDACIGGYPSPIQIVELGVDPASLDAEGRCLVLEFPAFVLFGIYSPANSNGQRDDFRYGFICALDIRIRNLEKLGKRVILTGDLNVSREQIDTAKAEESMRQDGLSLEEYLNAPNRRVFNQLLENGKVPGERDKGREEPVLWDTIRECHPHREGMFTHWEQKINARPGNFGSRIDYVLCSISMKAWVAEANIQEGLMGSDHCPVFAKIKDVVKVEENTVHIADVINPYGMFKGGTRLRAYDPVNDLLPLSGRLLPEFVKRRSIKEMFAKLPANKLTSTPSTRSPPPPNNDGPTLTSTIHSSEKPASVPDIDAMRSPKRVAEKRHQSASSPVSRAVKRSRSNANSRSSQPLGKGQQSLKGFFSTKQIVSQPDSLRETSETSKEDDSSPSLLWGSDNDAVPPAVLSLAISANCSPPPPAFSDSIIDPQASKESWTKIFSKRPSPRCEGHGDPCTSLITKKPGPNCGRHFWICSRPLGPSGQKETGTQWRCNTFVWASDWNGANASRNLDDNREPGRSA